jgi:protocatechuate 3,4-dioxygenase beta subunit
MARITRRRFVGALAAAGVLPSWYEALASSPPLVPSPGSARLTIPPAGAPGEPLVVTGRLVAPDGRTPLSNMTLSVYHTDASGYYTRPVGDPRRARLRGVLRTDESGGYEIRTIWPGHYPSGGNPRHIHVHLAGPDVPERRRSLSSCRAAQSA